MKTKPIVWATSALIIASTFCLYRVNSQEAALRATQEKPLLKTKEQGLQREKARLAIRSAMENNYRARLNNNSKRGGLKVEQLPEELRARAQELAREYTESIYPALKKYTAEHNGRLPAAAFTVADLAPFMEDTQYKGTGPKMYGRGSWAIAGVSTRMDGTMLSRDVYSDAPIDAPHDVWANYNNFANQRGLGKGFIITGWDDGRVTFDPVEQNFYGMRKDMHGAERPGAAIPGQAGIPPTFKQGLESWMKMQEEQMQEAQAKQQVENKQAKRE